MSSPAQKCPPAPVRTIARVCGFADAAVKALPRSSQAAPSRALRRAGRLIVITTIPPDCSFTMIDDIKPPDSLPPGNGSRTAA